METIRRINVLRDMELKEAGELQKFFSIQFWKKNGELVSLHRATTTGLRCDMKKNRLRGVLQVDELGNQIGHVYAVSIDLIKTYNGMRVKI